MNFNYEFQLNLESVIYILASFAYRILLLFLYKHDNIYIYTYICFLGVRCTGQIGW